MAMLNLLVDAPPEAVWEVIRDGHSYAQWVAGTQQIHEVDESWPEVGSKIHFTAGIGPWHFDDFTYVRHLDGDVIDLQAHAGRLGSARVSIEVRPWGEAQTLVVLNEHPLTGPPARWHNALVEVALRVRNRRMAAALKRLVEERRSRERG